MSGQKTLFKAVAHNHLKRAPCRQARGFTLTELVVVIGIMAVLVALAAPVFFSVREKNMEKAIYDVTDYVEMARSHAVANSTYVYLGFAEYDAGKPFSGPQTAGKGRVVVAAVASRDGTRGYADTSAAVAGSSWQNSYSSGNNLILLTPPLVLENVHIAPLSAPPSSGPMARPNPGQDAWRLGSDSFKNESQTPFSLPLGTGLGNGRYNLNQILIFLPNGSVCRQTSFSGLGQVSPLWLEIGLGPSVGTSTSAAISINGTTGVTKIYRP